MIKGVHGQSMQYNMPWYIRIEGSHDDLAEEATKELETVCSNSKLLHA